MPDRPLRIAASLAPVCVFLAVYASRVGHGFVLDDYGWIFDSRVRELSDVPTLFVRNSGFYRPVVSITFAIDYALFGFEPLWYGLTNLALAVTCAGLLYSLARALLLPHGAAIAAGSLWLLNFHGINMAVLWISGRTSLLLTAAALAAARSVVRMKPLPGALLTGLALLSKEEAVALPLILAAWIHVLNRDDPARRRHALVVWTGYSVLLLAAYAALRIHAGAMTPATAPAYYRFTFDAASIGRNVLEYADRTFTLAAIATIVAWVILRRGLQGERFPVRKDVIVCGVVWILGGYGLTLFLPVRSSLYACFPSVGACLIAAELLRQYWSSAAEGSKRAALIAAVVLTLIAAPIHYSRTRRLVAQAELSHAVWKELPLLTQDLPEGATVVIHDDMSRRANVHSAFGTLLEPAYELLTGRRIKFWIEPPAAEIGLSPPCPSCVSRRLALRGGSLTVVHGSR